MPVEAPIKILSLPASATDFGTEERRKFSRSTKILLCDRDKMSYRASVL